jgi:DMSO reductase family type II enzyme chaperone
MPTNLAHNPVPDVIDWQQTDLYRFFAQVFAPPTRQCFSFLAQPGIPAALHQLWTRLECPGEFPGFNWFASYELYESAYIALFDVGVPEPPVPLFESAHYKARPAQEIALENTYFYEVLGLQSNPSHSVPDYLITQLEFLAALQYTRDNTTDEAGAVSLTRAENEFLQRHLLDWVPIAESKLAKTEAPAFPVLMKLLAQFLRMRYEGEY